jgi:hypothetical protein
MKFLNNPLTPTKFRETLTNPANVIQVQIIDVDDPILEKIKEPKISTQLKENNFFLHLIKYFQFSHYFKMGL